MNFKHIISTVLLGFVLFGITGCDGRKPSRADSSPVPSEEGHDHDGTDSHDHADESESDHGEEVVRLTQAQLDEAGVVISPLGGDEMVIHVTLPAEVGLNLDTLLHVTSRTPGIVSEVFANLGDEVAEGDVLAVVESPQLGEAKIAHLQAIQSKAIADAELKRQRTISENTAVLLDLLKDEPELDEVREGASGLRIGENKGRLISAYAKMRAARANYARERNLRMKGLSTESDLLAVQEAYNSTLADYMAAFEDIDFMYRLRLQEAERSAAIAASAVEIAERRLHLLGLSEAQIESAGDERDADIARYELRAPVKGRIVEKHITPGEKVSDEAPVYTIADLDTVWLNISAYTEYAGLIREGQSVIVHAGDRTTTGVVDYLSAVVSEGTRTVATRVVIDNADRSWKPGEFVTARVEVDRSPVSRVVPIRAIQTFEGQEVIFVRHEDGIEPVPVRIGRRSGTSAEILGDDIALGTPVVVENSFLIKAELGKSAAGHDH